MEHLSVFVFENISLFFQQKYEKMQMLKAQV